MERTYGKIDQFISRQDEEKYTQIIQISDEVPGKKGNKKQRLCSTLERDIAR